MTTTSGSLTVVCSMSQSVVSNLRETVMLSVAQCGCCNSTKQIGASSQALSCLQQNNGIPKVIAEDSGVSVISLSLHSGKASD